MFSTASKAISERLQGLTDSGISVLPMPLMEQAAARQQLESYYSAATFSEPRRLTQNHSFTQDVRLDFLIELTFSDIRDVYEAQDKVYEIVVLLTGFKPLGRQPEAKTEGNLFITSCKFGKLDEDAGWLFRLVARLETVYRIQEN